jgi:hypothetical protein
MAISTASVSAAPWYGFSDYSVTGGQATPALSASLAAQEGAYGSRVTFNWWWLQPAPTTPNFTVADAIYYADLARGIRPLFVLTGAPPWALAPGVTCSATSACNYPPGTAHDADWQSIAAQIATRYPLLAGIEIWNEPNMTWAWAGGPDPARYTQLLRLAYTAIKAANPSMPVIGGALAADLAGTTPAVSMSVPSFLEAMYTNGARGYMDGISIHPYTPSLDWWYVYKALSITTEIRDANGDSVPLWVTETGLSTTGGWTTTQQAIGLPNLMSALLAYPDLAGVYINTLIERTSIPAGDPSRGFGVLYPNLGPKPAYCTLANAFHTGYRCPLLVAQPQASATQQLRWQAENLLQWAASGAIAWHKANGTYQGLSSAALHAADPRISATPLTAVNPGSSADPSQIGVWQFSPDGVLLCNASRADRSYCIFTRYSGSWTYANATGSAYQAAYVLLHGLSSTW